MGRLKRRPSIKKTCDFCNKAAFGLMRRHHEGKAFCSIHCEGTFINSRMIEVSHLPPDTLAALFRRPQGDLIAALCYP